MSQVIDAIVEQLVVASSKTIELQKQDMVVQSVANPSAPTSAISAAPSSSDKPA
jgi:hypothetical protein